MQLYDAIFIRKSVRSFESAPLDQSVLDGLVDFLSELEAPQGEIDWDFDILSYDDITPILAGPPKLLAPHYLVLRSQKVKGCLQNCGWLGEMAVLWLTAQGVGTCWQGGLECQHDFDGVLPYIVAIGFGRPAEPMRACAEDFDRKALGRLALGDTKGPLRPLLEAARLAPSSMGMQPIRYIVAGNRIHLYRKKPLLPMPQLSYSQCIDAGAAAAHLCAAGKAQGYDVLLERLEPAPEYKKNMLYQMTARCIRSEG